MGTSIYQQAFHLSDEAMVIVNQGQIADTNNAFADLLRKRASDVLAFETMPGLLRHIIHADDYAAAVDWYDAAQQSSYACRVVLADGVIRWWDFSLKTMGALRLLTVTDITEQLDKDERLRILQQAIEHSPASTVITDLDGHIEYVNRKFTSLTGYTYAEVKGKRPSILRTKYTSADTYKSLWKTIKAGKDWQGEFVNRRKDGLLFRELAFISPVKDADGTLTHFVAIKEDITQQRAAEEMLRESEERYRLLAENVNDVLWTMNPKGAFTYFSPSVEQVQGYTAEDALRQTVEDLFAPAEVARQAFTDFIAQATEHHVNESLHLELENLRGDGSSGWVELIAQPMYAQGAFIGLVGVTRDISERKQAEDERETLITELDAFAHTVAHDLKNPLGIMIGYVDLVVDIEQEVLSDDGRQYLTFVVDAGLKLIEIVDALLLFANLRGQQTLPIESLNMRVLADAVCERLNPMIEETNATITFSSEWERALGYGPWVEEIWANYLSNAIKYGGQPPVIEMGCEALVDGMLRFYVTDNGAGLTQSEQERLFATFARLERHAGMPGHGVGLSIVQRIVERLGGEVGVTSEPGRGSTFYFTLPAI